MFAQPTSAQSYINFYEDVFHKQAVNNPQRSHFIVISDHPGFLSRTFLCHLDGFPKTVATRFSFRALNATLLFTVCRWYKVCTAKQGHVSQHVPMSYAAPLDRDVPSAHTPFLGGISISTLRKRVSSPAVDLTAESHGSLSLNGLLVWDCTF